MIAENLKEGPLTLQEVGLTLTSQIQADKLIVHGIRSKDGTQFIGQLNSNNVDLEDIQELIEEKKVKVFPISDNLIKIKVGGTPILLIPKPKMQDQNHTEKETIKKLLKTQSQMEKKIQKHNSELLQHKTLINDLQMSFNDLKQIIELNIPSQESLKETVVNLSSQTQERLTAKIESTFDKRYKELQQLVKKDNESQKIDALNKDKIEEMKDQISELKKQISQLKFNLEDKMSNSLKVDKVSQLEKPDLQEKMQQNAKKKQMIKLALNKKFESVSARLNANSILIDDLKKQLRRQNDELKKILSSVSEQGQKLNQHETKIQATQNKVTQQDQKLKMHETKIQATQNKVTQQSDQLTQHQNKIKETSNTMVQQSQQLKQHETKLKLLRSYLQSKLMSPLQKLQFSLIQSSLNEPIRSCKWSEQLKSKALIINNNVVTLTKKTSYWEFCLLNTSFSNTLKSKQSWAIKINKKKNWTIYLGVCLKSKMIEYKFNDKNIKWKETDHGFYMIGSSGRCFSHLYKEFNSVWKSFQFGVGDVIDIEYDPIECKLRFILNKGDDDCEIPIIAPPQNDEYHPCVSLFEQDSSVQLLPQPQQQWQSFFRYN